MTAKRWLGFGHLLLASSALACGRTDLALTTSAGASGNPARQPDAAAAPDLAPLSSPDLAPPLGPDLAPDLRNPNCGNGRFDPGEECDDGNTLAGDGCDSNCRVECDWSPCPGPAYPLPVVCGDLVVGPGEECDDGNINPGDGCSDVCKVEPGFRCAVPGRRCAPICGDRMIVGMETCDDGNSVSGDGCSEFCLTEDCWDCSSGVCLPRPPVVDGGNCHGLPGAWCGDGKLQGAEECDEGAQNSDLAYGGCSTHCHYLLCGDGIVSEPEECDLGLAKNTAVYGDRTGCTNGCTVPHYCGDGYVDTDHREECDLGTAGNTSSYCTPDCHVWLP